MLFSHCLCLSSISDTTVVLSVIMSHIWHRHSQPACVHVNGSKIMNNVYVHVHDLNVNYLQETMCVFPCECTSIVHLSVYVHLTQLLIQTANEGTIINWETFFTFRLHCFYFPLLCASWEVQYHTRMSENKKPSLECEQPSCYHTCMHTCMTIVKAVWL